MKAMIWQLKQWTNYKMNKHNLCILRAYYIIPAFCSLCLNTRGITQNSYGRVPGEQKRPLATTYLSGTTECIRTGANYCSNINTFNLYLQKLFWKTRTLELPKFLQVKNLLSGNKNKTLQCTRRMQQLPTTRWDKGYPLHITLHWREGDQQAPYTEGWSFWSRPSVPWATTVAPALPN